MVSSKKKSFVKVLCIIISALIFLSALGFFATKIIYDNIFSRYDGTVAATGDEYDFDCGSRRLAGYFYDGASRSALIVMAVGQNSSAGEYNEHISLFLRRGFSVFIFDPTGCGKSEGASSVGFCQELYDLECALEFVNSKDDFGCKHLFLFGFSRGGYAACCALRGDYGVDAVVSVAGANSAMECIMDASYEKVGAVCYANYFNLWLYQAMLFGLPDLSLTAAGELAQTDVPVLLIHGKNDTLIRLDGASINAHSKEFSSNVQSYISSSPGQSGHKDLLFSPNGGANDNIMDMIIGFFAEKVKG